MYSSPVWGEISQELGNKVTSHNIYNIVKQNRNDVLSIARAEMGVHVLPRINIQTASDDSTCDESVTSESVESGDNYEHAPEPHKDQQSFRIILKSAEWQEIKPESMQFSLTF